MDLQRVFSFFCVPNANHTFTLSEDKTYSLHITQQLQTNFCWWLSGFHFIRRPPTMLIIIVITIITAHPIPIF